MNEITLVVMGKTGAGKSTLINAVLQEEIAPTGTGQTITKKNIIYTKDMQLPLDKRNSDNENCGLVRKTLNLYDTVGLEIDSAITEKTLQDTKNFLKITQSITDENDLTLVWFCLNCRSSRFEPYEIELIRILSVEYEIPFMIVLTQCYTDEPGELEQQIKRDFPEIPVARVLAKDYKFRNGSIPAHGITDLLQQSVWNYNKTKVKILKNKLNQLSANKERKKSEIDAMRRSGESCISTYSKKAQKAAFVPGGCIPFVHGLCIKMIMALNKEVGLNSSEKFASDVFSNAVIGLISTPFMVVPVLSIGIAKAYIETVGESYLDTLMNILEYSTEKELKDDELMAKRIKEELKKRT